MDSDKLTKILTQESISKEELTSLLFLNLPENVEELLKTANSSRTNFCGDEVHVRAVIDISNYCVQHCMYCEMREENYSIERYRMQPEEIVEAVRKIAKLGIGTVLLQSGEDLKFDTDLLAYIIYSIKQSTDIAVTLSFGERGIDEYRAWKIAGADRYILKFETSNTKKYSKDRSKKKLSDRIQHLKYLQRLGYQVGSGNIIGLPSQTIHDIVDDIFLLKEVNVDTALIDSFVPHKFTPYQNLEPGNYELTLKTIAATRLLLKDVHITTNLLDIYPNRAEQILNCGVNVIMPSFTPEPYRNLYSGIFHQNEENDPYENQKKLKRQIETFGRQISYSRGDSLKKPTSLSY